MYENLINQASNTQLLPRAQAAKILGLKPATLATWSCLGRYDLPVVKIGSKAMYRRIDLEAFIERGMNTE